MLLLAFVLSVQVMAKNKDLSCEILNMTSYEIKEPKFVLKNSCVTFSCQGPSSDPVSITQNNEYLYVTDWELQRDEKRYRYNSYNSANATVHNLKILNVMQSDTGLWACIFRGIPKYYQLRVWYQPSDKEPLCITNNKWPYYLLNDSFELNCSISQSEPDISLNLIFSESSKTSVLENNSKDRKQLLLKTDLDETSNGTKFNCSAFQKPPTGLILPPLRSSCSWGPIILFQNLDISLRYLNESVNKGSSFVFECKCNILDAFMTWNLSPLCDNQSYFEPGRSTITVHIPEDVNSSYLIIGCEATYRSKHVNTSDIFVISKSMDSFTSVVKISLYFVAMFAIIFVIALPVSIFHCKNRDRKEIYRTSKPGAIYYTFVRPCGSPESLNQGELVLRRLSTTAKDSEFFPSTPPKRPVVSMTPTTSIKLGPRYGTGLSIDGSALVDTEYNFIPADPPSRLSVCVTPDLSMKRGSIVNQENNVEASPSLVTSPTDSGVSGLEYECIPADSCSSKSPKASLWRSLQRTRQSLKIKQEVLPHEMPPAGFPSVDDLNPKEKAYHCIPPELPQRSSISTTPELSLKRNRSSRRRNDDKELVIIGIQPPVVDSLPETEYDCIPAEDNVEIHSSVVPEELSWEVNCTYDDNGSQFDAGNLTAEEYRADITEYDCIPSF